MKTYKNPYPQIHGFENLHAAYRRAGLRGYAWEWLNDWSQEDYHHCSPSANPLGPSSGSFCVLHSGSWVSFPDNTDGASRYGVIPVNT